MGSILLFLVIVPYFHNYFFYHNLHSEWRGLMFSGRMLSIVRYLSISRKTTYKEAAAALKLGDSYASMK